MIFLLISGDEIREQVIERMLQILHPFEVNKVSQIRSLPATLALDPATGQVKIEEAEKYQTKPPVVFISYSWEMKIIKNEFWPWRIV
jgi:hypothetical protein